MSDRAAFIKVPPAASGIPQTMPTDPEKRVSQGEIEIRVCTQEDAPQITEGLYASFPEVWWEKMEPLSRRPASDEIRKARFTKRILPTFSLPHMIWTKAVHLPTNTLVGVAGWQVSSFKPNTITKSGAEYYGWKERWTAEEFEDMWSGTDIAKWDGDADEQRHECMGEERHWYLAPLYTIPGWQGRGIGKLLLDWAIKQADATDPVTPLYLESAPYARAVYMHVGFEPVGRVNFVRRGPEFVKDLEAEDQLTADSAQLMADQKATSAVKELEVGNEVI